MSLRSMLRSLVYRPFTSADELWRKRSRWGEWNEYFGRQIFASDDRGYNPPFLSNPFSERNETRKWVDETHTNYEYTSGDRGPWADRRFEFVYGMVKDRIEKDAVILDVGGNAGYQLDNFFKKGFTNLWCIDPMKKAIEFGREHRPHINFVNDVFGPPQNDVVCDLLVCFGSIFRVPYGARIFEAIDRCSTKYVLMWVQEACDDFNRDPHVGLHKKGFICIEKHCVTADLTTDLTTDVPTDITNDACYIPIGLKGADGPMIVVGDRKKGIATQRNFRSVLLFRRIEPRPPAPKRQRGL